MTTATRTAPLRALDKETLYDLLMTARTAERITLLFKDGRILKGSLLFNHSKGTGRLINVEEESSLDFAIGELRDVRL
ncbi:MAG: hypothetical protein R3F34_17830 [Planctomycetota bacterium]